MAWTMFGLAYDVAGDLTDNSIYQPMMVTRDLSLVAIRTQIIFVDNPVFTDLSMKIYSDDDGALGKLLETSSDVRTKAELFTDNSAWVSTYFSFSNFNMKAGDTYNLVLTGTGYAPAGDSHLAWRIGERDLVYRTGFTPSLVNISSSPYLIEAVIAGEI